MIWKIQRPSPELKNAIIFSLALQLPILILSCFVNDFGQLSQMVSFAFLAFNSFLLLSFLVRPTSPTKFDLLLIRVGFLPTIALAFYISNFVWDLRGL